MFKSYLKIAFRNIIRHKGYSFINIFGLAVGIAALILILLYMQYELSFDNYHVNADQIYRLAVESLENSRVTSKTLLVPKALAPTLKEECPEIISTVRLLRPGTTVISYGKKNFPEKRLFFADPDILNIFSFNLLKGDPGTALKDPHSVILTEETAKKYFGDEDPMGKTLIGDGTYHLKVTGVLGNFPKNSHFIMDFVVPLEFYLSSRKSLISDWRTSIFHTYLLLRKDADPKILESKFPAILKRVLARDLNYNGPIDHRLFIQPLSEIHLYSHLNGELTPNSDIRYIYLFTVIALLILTMSCINYMNLATARSATRSKEVGIRKVVGAQRRQLIKQFLGESLALTFIALFFALLLVEIFLPMFNELIGRNLSFNIIENFQFVLGLFVLMVVVGLLAGSYPALALSSFKPVSAVGETYSKGPKGSGLRNFLVVTQFTISIILIICTLIIKNQLDFIKNKDMGFSKEQIVVLPIRDKEVVQKLEVLEAELLRNPNILYAASSNTLPNDVDWEFMADWPGKPEDVKIGICAGFADYDFIDLFDIKIIKGRNFSRDFPSDKNGAYLLNESAVKVLGWESPLGREFGSERWRGKVVGIIKDFHLHPLHQKINPLFYYLDPENRHRQYLSVKITANAVPGTIAFLEEKMKAFSPKYPFEYAFFDDLFHRAYRSEQKLGDSFRVSALIAVLIACLGLFGMASSRTENRTKEIGIRKVLGASVPGIIFTFSKEFTKWVILANIIAWPVAYYTMNKWLQGFAYRAAPGIGIFVLAGLLALVIALVTVSYQSVRAASINPVETLRYE